MNRINETFEKYFKIATIMILMILLLRTCGNDDKILSKRIDKLSKSLDSLQSLSVTKNDLRIEGLKSEKRMIQSTDRKMLDVNRQSDIDKELESLQK